MKRDSIVRSCRGVNYVMNVLFLSLLDFSTFEERNIYSDLLREFISNGHRVYCISPVERKKNQDTRLLHFGESCILKLKIGNTQKVNLVEKGISVLSIESLFVRGIKKFFFGVKFDLVLYATPPVTFAKVIRFIKKRDGARSYLMLKDIFPQNAVDLGMMKKTGFKSIIYKYFRQKEKLLYHLSDYIGCMSEANIRYMIEHNPEIDGRKFGICPNAVDIVDMSVSTGEKEIIRKKYGIPLNKTVFVYGGNLGKPQGIPFLIECLKKMDGLDDAYFLIIGSGTEYGLFQNYVDSSKQRNLKLMRQLPKEDYDRMVGSCDIGLIFLDYRFTIPNFPSRLLSYMQAKIPVIAVTDPNTDIGQTIINGNFGWWCESNCAENVKQVIEKVLKEDLSELGNHSWNYLKMHYSVDLAYESIIGPLKRARQ